ncbi:MAG: hypothetical protein ABI540_07870 [Spartobacteria bacterium]
MTRPHLLRAFVTDRRYAIDSSFAKHELEWHPLHNARQGIAGMVDWYLHHRGWWQALLQRTERFD